MERFWTTFGSRRICTTSFKLRQNTRRSLHHLHVFYFEIIIKHDRYFGCTLCHYSNMAFFCDPIPKLINSDHLQLIANCSTLLLVHIVTNYTNQYSVIGIRLQKQHRNCLKLLTIVESFHLYLDDRIAPVSMAKIGGRVYIFRHHLK